jgi:hypothetical protein
LHRLPDIHFSNKYLAKHGISNEEAVADRYKVEIGDTIRADELFIKTGCRVSDLNEVGYIKGLTNVVTITDMDAPLPPMQASTSVC